MSTERIKKIDKELEILRKFVPKTIQEEINQAEQKFKLNAEQNKLWVKLNPRERLNLIKIK